ncbi:HEPN domain-containing protein [Sporomusa sp. KB1]|jgi:hypothetical protein|uniref:HEPN domain-containing protein n=1 Tax=Sporomusa sp. KB1 TaxID=943346 RepID=UPI0011AA39AE|nr:HEPN domain-containing protein [Sporomusa sp. KB1]TWH47969.1 hypothetical protein Salpa_4097 [Sporomusa sp. KB1]
MSKESKYTLNLIALLPESWRNTTLFLSTYKILRVNPSEVPNGVKSVNFGYVQAIFIFGKLAYFWENQNIYQNNNAEIKIEVDLDNKSTSEGWHLVLLTPCPTQEGQDINTAKDKLDTIAGLFIAFNGQNILYEHEFDQIIVPSREQTSFSGRVFRNPMCLPKTKLDTDSLNVMSKVSRIIFMLPVPDQNRIFLSLRWLKLATYDEGINSFLKFWIALETLAMPDTNIKPLNERLARIYEMPLSKVYDTFQLGRIFGLRSHIVHNGLLACPSGNLLDYMQCIYFDILFDILNLPSEFRAATYLKNNQLYFPTF